jgi:RNA polymerase sigma factor (sigma-70 family)
MSSHPVPASLVGGRVVADERGGGNGATRGVDVTESAGLRLVSVESLGVAYRRCAGVLYRFFMVRLGGDRAETDDLMQRLWIAAQRNAAQVPEAELEFWFRGVAKKLLADRLRAMGAERRNLPRASVEVATALAERIGSERLPDEVLGDREAMDQLLLAMTALGSAEFEALQLHYFAGLSLVQIGERLGLSERAVEGRMYRARAELRERLRRIDE